ncbi:TRAP transporter permease [Rhodovulum sp. PH10]|uniref:TRAP transporter permease n=1 Tax=Rhodovulum sp. PH10 TaxID=1187851 RepID=UPI00192C9959|nr:TRAP transporter fused permease subunit [Rhodovulum sp. PH10]
MSSFLAAIRLRSPEGRRDAEVATASFLFSLLAVAVALLVIYGAYYGGITALILRSVFFSAVSAAGLIQLGLTTGKSPWRFLLYLLAIVALVPGPYLWDSYIDIIMRGAMSVPIDKVIFVGLVAVVLVLTRMTLGWALVTLVVASLAYAYFGDLIPGKYGHGGYDLARLASTLMLSTEGVYGVPMGVAVEYIFLFAFLGTLLMKIGTGVVFVDIARGITGRINGGPGLSAALSSALMGTINGSAVANVVTTGTFTIPLMKRVGYTPVTAGAIEAAAASAGQILPPVMGATAFLMAEVIDVPYKQIALAAIIPSFLYVGALLVAIRLEAGRLGLGKDENASAALIVQTLARRGYLLLPLVGLIVLLVMDYTPTRAAVMCIVFGLLISPWHRDTRITPLGLVLVCRDTLISTIPIIAAVAAAGIVIGVLNLTGLGLMLSSLILEVGGSNLWLILLLTAFTSFVLGMGLPTSAAYLLLAVLVAPALTKLGLPPMVAHMFIFYYGMISAITPPVALAAFAAASISGADPTKTGWEACRLGFVVLLIPFIFAEMHALLLIGSAFEIAAAVVLASIGVLALCVCFAGWLGRPMAMIERLAFLVGGILVMWPAKVADTSVTTLGIRALGVVVLIAMLVRFVDRAALQRRQPSRI